jgi:hypothetical protein
VRCWIHRDVAAQRIWKNHKKPLVI